MDYIEAFKKLKVNEKYHRKAPHKAILLLSIIELFENKILTKNEIRYDDVFIEMFISVWKQVLPNESFFSPDAYVPFWHMKSDKFWHIVPYSGKKEYVQYLCDESLKASEKVLKECVDYIYLDNDLYLLMTLPSQRHILRLVLLNTYFPSSPYFENYDDNDYQQNGDSPNETYERTIHAMNTNNTSPDSEELFNQLNEDLQIIINIEYYTFLKNHPLERATFKKYCPSVNALYNRISSNPIVRNEIDSSFKITYENFLCDLKIALLCEENSDSLVEYIEKAVEKLQPWYPDSLEQDTMISEIPEEASSCSPVETIAEEIIEVSAPTLEPTESDHPNIEEVQVTNSSSQNRRGLPWSNNEEELLTLFFQQGHSYDKIAASLGRTVVAIKTRLNLLGLIDYSYSEDNQVTQEEKISTIPDIKPFTNTEIKFNPKGNIGDIKHYVQLSYDYLWVLALIDCQGEDRLQSSFYYDQLACMMIANAWVLLNNNISLRTKENKITQCIEFLIKASKGMSYQPLTWDSPKEVVYQTISRFPVWDVFEDTIDELLSESPTNVLRAWFKEMNKEEIVFNSQTFNNSSLYGIWLKKNDTIVEVNPNWRNYLYNHHAELMNYFTSLYIKFLETKTESTPTIIVQTNQTKTNVNNNLTIESKTKYHYLKSLPIYYKALQGDFIKRALFKLKLPDNIFEITNVGILNRIYQEVTQMDLDLGNHRTNSSAVKKWMEYIQAGLNYKDFIHDVRVVEGSL